MAENKLRIKVTGPDGKSSVVELGTASVIVGSGEDAQVRIEDGKLAELHLRLKVKDGQVLATDLQTDEPTTVDGLKIAKDQLVKPGQVLKLAGSTVELLGDEKAASKSGERPKFEKGKGDVKGGKPSAKPAKGVEKASGPAAAAASASTDGNAARVLAPEAPPEEHTDAEKTEIVSEAQVDRAPKHASAPKSKVDEVRKAQKKSAVTSVLDEPKSIGNRSGMRDYAVRFLSEELPEALKPTKDAKRLQVALVWGRDQFVEVRDLKAGQSLRIGAEPGAFPVTHAAVEKGTQPLVVPEGEGFKILLPADTGATVSAGGSSQSLEKLVSGGKAQAMEVPFKGASYKIELDDRVSMNFGNLQVIARYTKPGVIKKRAAAETMDLNFMSTLVILILFAVAFERMIAITDFGDLNLSDDLFKNKDRFAKYVAKAEDKKKPEFKDLSGVKEGAKAKDDEGKFGKKEAQKKEADPSKKGAPVVDVNKREEDRKKVMNSGLLALLGGSSAGAVSNVFGPGGIGTGLNNALGGVTGGAGAGDAAGVGGLGSRGGGSGGGGNALGIGGFGGSGSGRGRGGSGEFDLGGKGKAATKFVPGKTTVVGGLTADEVGRIIRRHWNEIKYCYEKELNKNPNLYGKISVAFQIGPVGDVTVANIRETEMNDGAVEDCIISNVKRWKFPAPRGGGVVDVNYPFIFKSSN